MGTWERGALPVATGTVKWFNLLKGFGFITPDDGGKDFFVHTIDIVGDKPRYLFPGDKVRFVKFFGDKRGPRAKLVSRPNTPSMEEVPPPLKSDRRKRWRQPTAGINRGHRKGLQSGRQKQEKGSNRPKV